MARARAAPTVEYFWAEPDPEIVAQQIVGLSHALEDFDEPLLAAGALISADIKERFMTGTDPSGRPWDDWAKDYRKSREHIFRTFPDRASLHLSGDLERAATNPSAWRVTDNALFLDTSTFPEYWAWNNFGAERTNTRTKGLESSRSRAAFRRQHGIPFGKLRGENFLPERPFIGVSVEARAKIDALFEAWFVGEVTLATSTTGKRFFRHAKRGPGGQFVPRG